MDCGWNRIVPFDRRLCEYIEIEMVFTSDRIFGIFGPMPLRWQPHGLVTDSCGSALYQVRVEE